MAQVDGLQTFDEAVAWAHAAGKLPPQFVQPEDERPGGDHTALLSHLEPPTLDLSTFDPSNPVERAAKVAWLADICKDWGFFQVINHGIPHTLIKNMESFGFSFFELPFQIKDKVPGYYGKLNPSQSHRSWFEAINVDTHHGVPNQSLIDIAWPQSNQEYRDDFQRFGTLLNDISNTLLILILEGLQIDKNTIEEIMKSSNPRVRYNHYPPCPEPSLALGLSTHTDPNTLTLLFEDDTGGLEFCTKDGSWIPIEPISDAIIVNIGEVLEVWSNGAYLSTKHRALVNSTKRRLSFGFFEQPTKDYSVSPLQGTYMNDKKPPKFKPFKYWEYIKFRTSAQKGLASLSLFSSITTHNLS